MAKKQSLLMGALAGSFGIFVSKLLGLFYVVPLNSLAGESNMAFYSITYTYYDLLLKICSAGIPFAIAALVAKYLSRDDYKTVLLIKKLGASFSLALSFIVAIVFLLISSPLASAVLGSEASASDIKALNDLFYILSLALILVPFLSALRGYYQGLKLMKEYAASQVIEQLVRVSGIIILGFICVSILHLDSIYAIYMAIFSAALGALFAIIYVLRSAKDTDKEITLKAQSATKEARDRVLSKWSQISPLSMPEYKEVVALLQDGQVVAASDEGFILTYKHEPGCKRLLREDNRKVAEQIVDYLFDASYPFTVMPEAFWLEQRQSYLEQKKRGEEPRLKQYSQDIKNVINTAHSIDVPVPYTAQLFEILQSLKISGHMDEDHSGIAQYFENLAGVKIEKK